MIKLLNCPFCGSSEVAKDGHVNGNGGIEEYTQCFECMAIAPDEIWNRRAAPPIGTRYRNADNEVVAVVVPANITAETGHKAALSGEFVEVIEDCCCECEGSGVIDDEDCEFCTNGATERRVGVSWTNIKAIHQAMLAATPEPKEGA